MTRRKKVEGTVRDHLVALRLTELEYETICDLAKEAGNIPVWVGIRPEGFYVDENGPLACTLKGIEVMGRDVTVVSTHPAFQGDTIRTIIDAKSGVDPSRGEVRYRLRQGKVYVFDKSNGERLYGE